MYTCRLSICNKFGVFQVQPAKVQFYFQVQLARLLTKPLCGWGGEGTLQTQMFSAPHPFYTINTTKSPQKCTKQNAISRKRNTACLYAACLYVCMPPTGCWPACPSSCRLSSRCLSPACRFAISLPDICPHPVCVPAAHPFGLSSPPSLHNIYNNMTTKMHQTECYKSEEKHCLSICLLSVCLPVAWLPAACLPVFLPPTFLVPKIHHPM